jgi:hypothetical protein
MVLKISFAVGIIASFIYGVVTFFKFYGYISSTELFLLVFLRALITFILFFGIVIGCYFFLKREVPEAFSKLKFKKPAPTKVDYVLPSISPTEKEIKEVKITEPEKKEKLPIEVTKDDAENIAMVVRTLMAQE